MHAKKQIGMTEKYLEFQTNEIARLRLQTAKYEKKNQKDNQVAEFFEAQITQQLAAACQNHLKNMPLGCKII